MHPAELRRFRRKASLYSSRRAVPLSKDFAEFTAEELAVARDALARLAWSFRYAGSLVH
jgi:hypothetical protein